MVIVSLSDRLLALLALSVVQTMSPSESFVGPNQIENTHKIIQIMTRPLHCATRETFLIWSCIISAALLCFGAQCSLGGSERVYVSGDAAALDRVHRLVTPINEFPSGFTIARQDAALIKDVEGISLSPVHTMQVKGTIELIDAWAIANHRIRSHTQQTFDQTPWGIESVYNDQNIISTSGGGGRIVAVLDTGVSPHQDLPAPLQCRDYTTFESIVVDGECDDRRGHGTFVTGIILANAGPEHRGLWGVAPNAQYFSYKVLNDSGFGFDDNIARAMRDAVDEGAHIINLSLGDSHPSSIYFRDAVQYATNRGVLIVAASGNDGPSIGTMDYPAALADVMGVGALEMIQPGNSVSLSNLRVANFSSRGISGSGSDGIQEGELDVAAPGREIISTFLNGAYAIGSGTSFSCPHVAGLAAKLWFNNGNATRTLLQNRARMFDITLSDGGGADQGYDPASGFGEPRV